MFRLTPSTLHGARQCVRPELANLPAGELAGIVESSMAEVAPAAAESFLKQLGSLGKSAGSTLKRAAPGIMQGAASGASVGGPWGALIGAGAGLASSAVSKGKPGAPAATAPMPAGPTPLTQMAAALPTGQGAASTLASLFDNPLVRQALLSQGLGATGNQQVTAPTGASLPRGAINGLLMQLLANASEGLAEADEVAEQEYLMGESGEYLIDPASPEQQAAVVLAHLEAASMPELANGGGEFLVAAEWMTEDTEDWESEEWLEAQDTAEMVRFF